MGFAFLFRDINDCLGSNCGNIFSIAKAILEFNGIGAAGVYRTNKGRKFVKG